MLTAFGVLAIALGLFWLFGARYLGKRTDQAAAPFAVQGLMAILFGAYAIYSAISARPD